MSGFKHYMQRIEELEEQAWERVARASNFSCTVCGGLLSKDEVGAFGGKCSNHQEG